MNPLELELPSNRKFGTFFTAIFALGAAYFFATGASVLGTALAGGALGVGLVTLIKDDLLSLPNQLWMRLGYILGLIVSPVVLGILFFLIITPVAVITRQFGRDELCLRSSSPNSHWKQTEQRACYTNFKNQF